jgi:hypothetical protein
MDWLKNKCSTKQKRKNHEPEDETNEYAHFALVFGTWIVMNHLLQRHRVHKG